MSVIPLSTEINRTTERESPRVEGRRVLWFLQQKNYQVMADDGSAMTWTNSRKRRKEDNVVKEREASQERIRKPIPEQCQRRRQRTMYQETTTNEKLRAVHEQSDQ